MGTRKGSKKLGAQIRARRKERGLSITEAAFHAGMSAKYWAAIESATKPLTDSAWMKMARVLGMTLPTFDPETKPRGRSNGRTDAHASRKVASAG